MHSSYQIRETHYGNLSLSIHDRINDLSSRAERLAPAVYESAMDSGCTDETKASHAKLGPRQQKAWDMVAEGHSWNAISDDPALVAQAEQYERDGIAHKIEYVGGMDPNVNPWAIIVTEQPEPQPVTVKISKGDRVQHIKTRKIGTAAADEHITVSRRPAIPVRWDGSTRVPVPSFTENLVKLSIEYLRSLRDDLGRFPTAELEDEWYRLLGERYDPDGSHGLREPDHDEAEDEAERQAHNPGDEGDCAGCGLRIFLRRDGVWDLVYREQLQTRICSLRNGVMDQVAYENATPHRPADPGLYLINGVPACGAPVDGGRCCRGSAHDGHPHIKEPGTEVPQPASATSNMEYVRNLLRQKQPGFAAALDLAVASVEMELTTLLNWLAEINQPQLQPLPA